METLLLPIGVGKQWGNILVVDRFLCRLNATSDEQMSKAGSSQISGSEVGFKGGHTFSDIGFIFFFFYYLVFLLWIIQETMFNVCIFFGDIGY